jgi:hypothetical protein
MFFNQYLDINFMKYFITIIFMAVSILTAQDDLKKIYFPGEVIYDSYIQYTESSGDKIIDVQLLSNKEIIDIDIVFESVVETSPDIPYPYVKGNFVLNIPEDFNTDFDTLNIRTIYEVADTLVSNPFYILDEFKTSVIPLHPYNNESEVSLYPQFIWQSEELEHLGPYWLEVFYDEECTQKVLGVPVIDNNFEIYQKLKPETQYFWRVRSSAGIEPLYLDTFAFTTGYDYDWAVINKDEEYSFENMHISSEGRIFIITKNAVYTKDNFESAEWSQIYDAPNNSILFDMAMSDEQLLLPVKNNNDTLTFAYSSNSGKTWEQSENIIFISDNDYRICEFDSSVILGTGNNIYILDDFGMSNVFNFQLDSEDMNISKIYNTNSNNIYIIAETTNENSSKVYFSKNGSNWNEVSNGINTNIINNDITELPDNSLYISANKGSDGYMYFSETGEEWEEILYSKGKPYISIESDNNGILYLFTNSLRDSLYFSEDLGSSFSSEYINYYNFVVKNSYIDKKGYVYVYNSRGVLLRKKLNPIPEGIIHPADTFVVYNDVNVKWMRDYSAVKYHLQMSEEMISGKIASELSENDYVINDSTILKNSYRTTALNNNTDYFWRVRSKTDEGWSEWSKIL